MTQENQSRDSNPSPLVKTKDGSYTFFNKKYNQYCHSEFGAADECREKLVAPCLELKRRKEIGWIPKILDIGFGMGYNSAAAFDLFGPCKIIGLENNQEIIKAALTISAPFKSYPLIQKALSSKDLSIVEGKSSINIIFGDAAKTIDQAGIFDIVFFHQFPESATPELWSQEFIDKVYTHMAKDSMLTTYICSKAVRERLKKAGFIVKDGPVIGRRGPGTIGCKKE